MPMASATAPAIDVSGNPAPTAPKATPTANPSGILCMVIARTIRVLRGHLVLIPSASDSGKLRCRWGRNLSIRRKKPPPQRKPAATTNHEGRNFPSAITSAGASRDQKLAAIITPAAKPSIASRVLRLGSCCK